jgi:hypothetical protein
MRSHLAIIVPSFYSSQLSAISFQLSAFVGRPFVYGEKERICVMQGFTWRAALLIGVALALVCFQRPMVGAAAMGVTYYVDSRGADTNDGRTARTPFQTIQVALDMAQPGDTIRLASGVYAQDLRSIRDGAANQPITITGPADAVVTGGGVARVVEINHNFITLDGFTIDGKHGGAYRDKLVYVLGTRPKTPLRGLVIRNMRLTNAGGECVRLRYYVQGALLQNNVIGPCGWHDFPNGVWAGDGKNGEGIYIGTAPEQRGDGKNPEHGPDRSDANHIVGNRFNTQGNECVDIKEGASGNLIERNDCQGSKDPEAAGFSSRGNGNTFRFNTSYNNLGAGIRFGGDTASDGIHNLAYGNTVFGNQAGGFKLMTAPQGVICGNTLRDNARGDSVGKHGATVRPQAPCPATLPTAQPTAPSPTSVPAPTPPMPNPAATTTPRPSATSAPTVTLMPRPSATSAPTATPPTGACTVVPVQLTAPTFIEAEAARSAGRFTLVADASRSGGAFMTTPGHGMDQQGDSVLSFPITVAEDTELFIWALGHGADKQTDSFFVDIDDDDHARVHVPRGDWGWKIATDSFSVSAGAHTLRISNREDGSQIDKLVITTDKEYTPTGMGDAPICGT